jgi:hypothetical protein
MPLEDLSPEKQREWRELMERPQSNSQLLSSPKFWEFYFFSFCDEKKIKEFSEACAIPAELIRKKRNEWLHNELRQWNFHRNNGTIN